MKILFAFFLLLSGFYLSYRYPFMINSSLTSPTYQDTPDMLMYGKYAFFLCLYFFIFISLIKKCRNFKLDIDSTLWIIILFFGVFISIFNIINGSFYTFKLVFFMFLPILFLLNKSFRQEEISYVIKLMRYIAIIYILFDFYQVFAFYFFNRLPALAYYNSVSVRFGSIVDDPNGFAILCSMFLFVFMGKDRIISFKWAFILLILLVLTQSLTGIASVIFSLIFIVSFVSLYRMKFSSAPKVFFIMVAFLMVFLVVFINSDILHLFWSSKQGSIDAHDAAYSYFSDNDVLSYILPPSNNQVGENFYINLVFDAGLLYSIFFIIFIFILNFKSILIVRKLLLKSNNRSILQFSLISFSYVLCVSIGSLNLPLLTIFPVNAFFWFFAGFILFFSLRESYEIDC